MSNADIGSANCFLSRCCTHHISRFYWQAEYAMLIEFLSAIGHRLRPRWVLTIPPEFSAFQLISPMTREVAATFLPHPAQRMQQYIAEELPR